MSSKKEGGRSVFLDENELAEKAEGSSRSQGEKQAGSPQVDSDLEPEPGPENTTAPRKLFPEAPRSNRASNLPQGYIRHPVRSDGDCGYTAFGITREYAYTLLSNNIEDIKDIIKLPVEEALLTEEFYDYLVAKKTITMTREKITNPEEGISANLAVSVDLQNAYIAYDVRDKQVDGGWAHPKILQALAHFREIELRMWCLGENGVLIPHRVGGEDYSVYRPAVADERVDLLFINRNHFERLEFQDYENDAIPNQDVGPFPPQSPAVSRTPQLSKSLKSSQLVSHRYSTADLSLNQSRLSISDINTTTSEFIENFKGYFLGNKLEHEKQECLKKIVRKMLKLSSRANGFAVCAHQAKTALASWKKTPTSDMNDVYPHIFTLLQATVFEAKKSQADYAEAAAMLLAEFQKMRNFSKYKDFAQVHQQMLKSRVSANLSALEMLTQIDTSGCLPSDKIFLEKNQKANIYVQNILRHCPFHWRDLYRVGVQDRDALEQRLHYEMLGAALLQAILRHPEKKLSVEEQWLVVQAIIDYKQASASQSPFYNAIVLLEVMNSNNLQAALNREGKVCDELYDRVLKSLVLHSDNLTNEQIVIKEKTQACLVKHEATQSAMPHHSSYWGSLLELHIDSDDKATADELDEREIKFILSNFDAKFSSSLSSSSKYLALLDKAFKNMYRIFAADPKGMGVAPASPSLLSFFSSSPKVKSSCSGFDNFMACIVPPQKIPPYAFNHYCVYQSTRKNDGAIARLSAQEATFIMQHIRHLYDHSGKFLGTSEAEGSIIELIYEEWNKQLSELEKYPEKSRQEAVRYHTELIQIKGSNNLIPLNVNNEKLSEICTKISNLLAKELKKLSSPKKNY